MEKNTTYALKVWVIWGEIVMATNVAITISAFSALDAQLERIESRISALEAAKAAPAAAPLPPPAGSSPRAMPEVKIPFKIKGPVYAGSVETGPSGERSASTMASALEAIVEAVVPPGLNEAGIVFMVFRAFWALMNL